MRFQPGQSGNPAGRQPGSRNKRTILADRLFDDRAGTLTEAAIGLATVGDPAALRVCMDRVAPPLRQRPIEFALPELTTAAHAVTATNAIVQGVAHGELIADEADALMRLVRGFILVLAAADLERRITRIEAQLAVTREPDRDVLADDDDDDDIGNDDSDDAAGPAVVAAPGATGPETPR
jgi:hypothetical protein